MRCSRPSPRWWIGLALGSAVVPPASAQWTVGPWTVTDLRPPEAYAAWVLAIADGQQVGYASFPVPGQGIRYRASLWTGTAASWVNLHPAGLPDDTASIATCIGDGVQGGYVGPFPGAAHQAGLWSGSAASWLSLEPSGYIAGASSTQLVGYSGPGPNAGIWSSTGAPWVNLQPAGVTFKTWAFGTDGAQQVGVAKFFPEEVLHACMWTGTAESWTDLRPAGAGDSWAYGVHNGQQVGYAAFGGDHAGLWTGTAESWVDLHPPGATSSIAYAVYDGYQVGRVGFGGLGGPVFSCMWHGTAESWELLPWGFEATGVWHDGTTLYVVGNTGFYQSVKSEPLLWSRPLDFCYPDCTADGSLTVADFGCFQTKFVAADPYADCNADGALTVADFGCFQTAFVAGCP